MNLGQQSAVYYASKLGASLLGFAATVYIARILGPDPLGIYHVTVGLVAWLGILGNIGISNATIKRVSEGSDQGAYAVASLTIVVALFLVVAGGTLLFRERVVSYIGYPAAVFVVLFLLVSLLNGMISALLEGLQLVHLSGVLSTVRTGGRAAAQIVLIVAGFETLSLFLGHLLGYGVVVGIGGYYVLKRLPSARLPDRSHFRSLTDFAKFSWLGSLQSRMFSYTDVLVLGAFVSSGLVGIYAAAWNIAHFLILFSGTLRTTLFPEMSNASAEASLDSVSRMVEQSLSFGGLFSIPGLLGGVLLGERILRIYGPEFPKGATILSILILANVFMSYQQQLLNALNAVDRPDIAFRANLIFVVVNVVLNVTLVYLYGWIGAAIATCLSVLITLSVAYWEVKQLIGFQLPVREITMQWLAAGVMSVYVYAALRVQNVQGLIEQNYLIVSILVVSGAAVYFAVLLMLSAEFRNTVRRNVPVEIPALPR